MPHIDASGLRTFIAVAFIAASAVACGDARGSRVVSVGNTLNGVRQLAAVEEVRIDGMAADLVPIAGLTVATDGRIAILQRIDHSIRFFSPSGSTMGSFGHRGDGPGEFRQMTRFGWLADTLWVHDAALARVTLIAPDRTLGRTIPLAIETHAGTGHAPGGLLFPFAVYDDSTYLAVALNNPERVTFVRAQLKGGSSELAVLQYARDLRFITRDGVTRFADLLPADPVFAVSPHGLYFAIARKSTLDPQAAQVLEDERRSASAAAFPVTVFTSTGDTVYSRVVEVAGEKIPESAIDSMIRSRTASMDRGEAAAFRRGVIVPAHWPPVEDVVIDDDGNVWVRLRKQGGLSRYLRLDEAGTPSGLLALPERTVIAAVTGRVLWCLESDQNDVQSIVRYRIEQDR